MFIKMSYAAINLAKAADAECIRYLAETYAQVYYAHRLLVNECKRILSAQPSDSPAYFLGLYARSLRARLDEFEQNVPRNLAEIVDEDIKTMKMAANPEAS